jgi:hypothetical protein
MNKNILYPSRELKRYSAFKAVATTLFFLVNIAILIPLHAQDGATLHSENCIACHSAMTGGEGSVLYTRDDRNVTSLEALGKQVNRCQTSLELNWSSDQINDVQKYLNKSFYLF